MKAGAVPIPFIYVCFFLSGFSGLVNEVVWSRLFVYTMGSSHLSIAVVVSVFMGGLALGSLLGGPLADRSPSPLRLYGWLVGGAGLLCGAVAPLLWAAEPLLGLAYRLHDGQPNHPFFTVAKAAVCAVTILLPTTLMGATLPALARHTTRSLKEVGSRIAFLYAVNTFGAVAGAAAAGFFLVGRLGLGWTAALAALIDVLVGAAILIASGGFRFDVLARAPAALAPAPASPSALGPSALGSSALGSSALGPSALARSPVPFPVRVAVLAFGVSGFVNMCLQLGWTRTLIISIGNSTYAFSVIVGIFIFGLAAGGWIAGLFADRLKRPLAAFGWLLVATAVASGATIPWLGLSPSRFAWQAGDLARELARLDRSADFNFVRFMTMGAGAVALAILPSTLLMGMAFPLVGRLRALDAGGVGRAVGAAYASNTIGCILGTALTGFLLVPLLGRVWALLYIAVGLGFLAGAAVLLAGRKEAGPRGLAVLAGVLAVCLAGAWFTRPHGVLDADTRSNPREARAWWHPAIFARGAYNNLSMARQFASHHEYSRAQIRIWEPLYYRDGEAASVAVLMRRDNGHLCLNITGKTDASAGDVFSFDLQTQLLMGHLPLLLHPAPERALNLGLGGGMSLGAMVIHPLVKEIDLLELSPEVEEAARLWFADANHSALLSPKVRKVIGDGRNHLTHTARKYDVISSEPSNFWIAGLGNLFTREFYEVARSRLNPGGMVCQWIYGYNLRLEDYKVALRTFLDVFPHVTVWANSYGDTILIGSPDPIAFDRSNIERSLADTGVRADLATIGVLSPEDLFRYFQADKGPVERWVGDGPRNRDLSPVLEFTAPLGFYAQTQSISLALTPASEGAVPAGLFKGFDAAALGAIEKRRVSGRALTRFYRHVYDDAMDKAIAEYAALARGEGDSWSLDTAAREIFQRAPEMGAKKAELIRAARAAYDTPELCMADGFQLGPSGDARAQIEAFRRAARQAPPDRWEPYYALAAVEARWNESAASLKTLEIAEQRGTPSYKLDYVRGVALGIQGDLVRAETFLRRSLADNPDGKQSDKGETAYNLAYCLEQAGKPEEAVKHYHLAIELENDPVRSRLGAARCLRRLGRLEAAMVEAQAGLKLADEHKRQRGEARAEVGRIHAASGVLAEALRWMQDAAQTAPGLYDGELAELRKRMP